MCYHTTQMCNCTGLPKYLFLYCKIKSMKKIKTNLSLMLFCLALAVTTDAQLNNGEIVKIKNVSSGKYAIPKDVSTAADANVVIMTNRSDAWFTWKVVSTGGGYFKFQNMHTNMFLGILNSSKEQYGFVAQKNGGNQADLQWKLVNISTGFKLQNKNSNLFLAIEGGSKANNAKLVQWGDQGQADIQWQFETIGSGSSTASGKKVLFDVVLNYLAVSEATRNKIDNGDCKRIFGLIRTELWELDNNNEMKTKLQSYNNMPEMIYSQTNYEGPPTAALSYYQDNPNASANNQMEKVTYNIPESLLKDKKVMLVVKTYLGTRHKDNDFASFDALRMKEEVQNTYILDARSSRTETIQTITEDASVSGKSKVDMVLLSLIIPSALFTKADDTHKIWVKFSTKIN